MRLLTAKAISLSEDDALRRVSFADDAHAPQHYCLFQLAKAPTDQDYDLGHDRLYVEIDDPAQSAYGAVRLIQYGDEGIDLHLRAGTLGLPAEGMPLRIETNVDNTLWKAACTTLRAMAAMGGAGVSERY